MRRRSVRGLLVVALLAGVWFAWLGPRELGGPAAYVVAEGNSMEPGISAGDLVVTHRADSYEVGDVVAYDNADLGRQVLHRIVGEEDGRLVLQGDNNDWLDSYRPTLDEVIGERRLLVPRLGTIIMTVRELLVPLALGVAVLVAGAFQRRTNRRDDAETANPVRRVHRNLLRDWWLRLPRPAVVWSVTAGLVALVVLAYVAPPTRPASSEEPYTHRGRFEYRATTPEGSVYADGVARAGDPVYLRLTDSVDVAFQYQLEGRDVRQVDGTAHLDLVVSERGGWSRRIPLQEAVPVDGASVNLEGTVDLAALSAQLRSVEESTGWVPGVYQLSFEPVVEFEALVSGQTVSDSFAPAIEFDLDDVSMRLVATSELDGGGDPLVPTAVGTVSIPTEEASTVPVLGISVGSARPLTVLAALGGIGVAGLAGAAERRRQHLPPQVQVQARTRVWVVDGHLPAAAENGVELTDFDTLLAFADAAEAPIIHEHVPDRGDVYGVWIAGVWHRYEIATLTDVRDAAHSWAEMTVSSPYERVDGAVRLADRPVEAGVGAQSRGEGFDVAADRPVAELGAGHV